MVSKLFWTFHPENLWNMGTWEHDLNWIYFSNYVFSTSTQTSPEKLRSIWASHRTWWNWSSGRFTRNRAEMICRDVNRYNVIRRFDTKFEWFQTQTWGTFSAEMQEPGVNSLDSQCWDQSMYSDKQTFKNLKFFFPEWWTFTIFETKHLKRWHPKKNGS